MDFFVYFGLSAATWYVSYVVTSSEGPGGVFEWIREHVWHGRRGKTATGVVYAPDVPEKMRTVIPSTALKNGLLDCIVCTSFWVALILQWVLLREWDITGAFAIAGLAMLLHGFSNWRLG